MIFTGQIPTGEDPDPGADHVVTTDYDASSTETVQSWLQALLKPPGGVTAEEAHPAKVEESNAAVASFANDTICMHMNADGLLANGMKGDVSMSDARIESYDQNEFEAFLAAYFRGEKAEEDSLKGRKIETEVATDMIQGKDSAVMKRTEGKEEEEGTSKGREGEGRKGGEGWKEGEGRKEGTAKDVQHIDSLTVKEETAGAGSVDDDIRVLLESTDLAAVVKAGNEPRVVRRSVEDETSALLSELTCGVMTSVQSHVNTMAELRLTQFKDSSMGPDGGAKHVLPQLTLQVMETVHAGLEESKHYPKTELDGERLSPLKAIKTDFEKHKTAAKADEVKRVLPGLTCDIMASIQASVREEADARLESFKASSPGKPSHNEADKAITETPEPETLSSQAMDEGDEVRTQLLPQISIQVHVTLNILLA